jgi:LysR family transcriptional regulator, benzoate and cis,cis-muconate-responsive activator of ben and cat genes
MSDFEWTELRRISPVLVMPESHPLAKMKKIAPARLRELPLIGLARENYPDYVPAIRSMLRPFGVTPRFVAMINDGITALFPALEANRAAAILPDGAVAMMPRSLVARSFSPALPDVSVKVGVTAARTNPHAATFARLLREEAVGAKDSAAKSAGRP